LAGWRGKKKEKERCTPTCGIGGEALVNYGKKRAIEE